MPQTESERGSDPAGRFVAGFIDDYETDSNPSLSRFLESVPSQFKDEVRRRCEAFLRLQSALDFEEPEQDSEQDRPIPGPLGDFTPLSVLGRGGMGTVYLAEQASLGRKVALKVLAPHLASSPRRKERFRREALAIAKLRHPNIVQVLSYGEEQDAQYLAMEYIEGKSLAEVIREMRDAGPDRESAILHALGAPETRDTPTSGRLPTSRSRVVVAAGIALRVCEALAFAHAQGIIHRDVKPSNILLRDGVPLLVDFGLAKDLDDERLSLSGDVIGTPHYMSPEQARRKEVDARTDVYSLGVTLYELVTGQLPFDGEGLAQILDQVQSKEPTPLRKIRDNVPLDLETIVLKCMEKNPDRRYESVEELGADLRCFLELRPISARPIGAFTRSIRWVRQHPARFLSLVLLLVVVLSAPIFWTLREAADRQQVRADLVTEQRDGLRLLAESKTALRRSPGLALVLAVEGAERVGGLHANNVLYEAWRASVRRGRELRTLIGHTALVRDVKYSPDGSLIASSSNDATLRIWRASDGETLHVLEGHQSEVGGFSFSHDGRQIVSISSDATARVWDVATGRCLRVLAGHDAPLSFGDFVAETDEIVTASIDGTVRIWNGDDATVLVRDLITFEHSRYTDFWGYAPYCVDVDGSRKLLVAACYNGLVRVVDLTKRSEVLQAQMPENRVTRVHIAPDGSFISSVADGVIRTWDMEARMLGEAFGNHADAVPSPDGTGLAIYKRWNMSSEFKILSLMSPDLKTTISTLHMESQIGPIDVRFSGSGRHLVALDPASKSFVWDVETGESIAQLLGHETQVLCAGFSPDETRVVTGAEDSDVRVWQLEQDSFVHHYPIHPSRSMVNSICLSDDGSLLASGSTGPGLPVVSVASGKNARTTTFSAPIREVSFAGNDLLVASSSEVVRIRLEDGERLWSVNSPRENWLIESADVHPDGSRFVCGGRFRLDGWAMIFDPARGEPTVTLQGHVKVVRSVCYSPDGDSILTASLDGTARLWNSADGSPLRTFFHGADVRDARFSNDGSRIVTGGWDRNVRVWDVATGELLETLTAHSHSVESCLFSPSDEQIISASLDGTVRVWQDERCVAVLDHGGWLTFATFGPAGKEIFVGTDTGSVYRWPFPPLQAAQARIPRVLTPRERQRFTGASDPEPAAQSPNLALAMRNAWESIHGPDGTAEEYAGALEVIQEIEKESPDPGLVSDLHGAALIRCDRPEEGLEWLFRARQRELDSIGRQSLLVLSFTTIGLARLGRRDEAREVFDELQKQYDWVISPRIEIDMQNLVEEARSAIRSLATEPRKS